MQIDTNKVRAWLNTYKQEFDSKNDKVSAGVVLACNGLLTLLTNYEEIEGEVMAKEKEIDNG